MQVTVHLLYLVGEIPKPLSFLWQDFSDFSKTMFSKNAEHHLAIAWLGLGNSGLFRMEYNVIFEKYQKDEMTTFPNFQNNSEMNIPENAETMLTH